MISKFWLTFNYRQYAVNKSKDKLALVFWELVILNKIIDNVN
jgi:hypothetical protein